MRNRLLLLCLLLGSCVPSYLVTRPELVYNFKSGKEPSHNVKTEVKVEKTIYTEFNYRVNPAVELEEDLNSNYGKVPSNVKLSKVTKDDREAYASISVSGRSITYLADRDQNGMFDHIMVQARKNRTNWKRLETEAAYKRVEGIKAESGGFEKELIFEGTDENVFKISYYEYIEDLTRAAVVREDSFDLSETLPDTVSYNGSRIEILHADPDKLTYRVLEGFSSQLKKD